jgi:hypothetical protein
LERWLIVFLRLAAETAFFTLRLAAVFCLAVDIGTPVVGTAKVFAQRSAAAHRMGAHIAVGTRRFATADARLADDGAVVREWAAVPPVPRSPEHRVGRYALEEFPDESFYGGLVHFGHGEQGRFRTLVPVRLLRHRGFDGLSGIGHAGSQKLRARCSDEIHILEEKALTVDRRNRFEIDGHPGTQWPNGSAGREVAGVDLPIGNLTSVGPRLNCSLRK